MKNGNKLPIGKQKEIAERLKDLRTSFGYTQDNIAEKINVTTKTYREWEVGKYEKDNTFYYPSIGYDNLLMLSEVYHVSTDYLLCHSDCTSVEDHYISKKTGLSGQSISVLRDWKNRKDIIDAFISSQEYEEYNENALHFLELRFENFQFYVKQYMEILKIYVNTDKKDYGKTELLAKQADELDLKLEICVNYIENFGHKESFIFEKFLDEYKKKLAIKYEYDKFMQMLKDNILKSNT